VETGSLYPALHRLEGRGWVAAEWKKSDKGKRARYYRLTPSGRRQFVVGRTEGAVQEVANIFPDTIGAGDKPAPLSFRNPGSLIADSFLSQIFHFSSLRFHRGRNAPLSKYQDVEITLRSVHFSA